MCIKILVLKILDNIFLLYQKSQTPRLWHQVFCFLVISIYQAISFNLCLLISDRIWNRISFLLFPIFFSFTHPCCKKVIQIIQIFNLGKPVDTTFGSFGNLSYQKLKLVNQNMRKLISYFSFPFLIIQQINFQTLKIKRKYFKSQFGLNYTKKTKWPQIISKNIFENDR